MTARSLGDKEAKRKYDSSLRQGDVTLLMSNLCRVILPSIFRRKLGKLVRATGKAHGLLLLSILVSRRQCFTTPTIKVAREHGGLALRGKKKFHLINSLIRSSRLIKDRFANISAAHGPLLAAGV